MTINDHIEEYLEEIFQKLNDPRYSEELSRWAVSELLKQIIGKAKKEALEGVREKVDELSLMSPLSEQWIKDTKQYYEAILKVQAIITNEIERI